MPPSQIAETVTEIVAQPVDKLATIIGILGVVLVIILVWIAWRVIKYFTNPESPLVKVLRDIRDAFNGLKGEQSKVYGATQETNKLIGEQTVVLLDFKNFQKLNNDQVADLARKVETNGDQIEALRKSLDALTEQIKNLLDDKAACQEAEDRIRVLRDEILEMVQQQQAKHATGETATIHVDTVTEDKAA